MSPEEGNFDVQARAEHQAGMRRLHDRSRLAGKEFGSLLQIREVIEG